MCIQRLVNDSFCNFIDETSKKPKKEYVLTPRKNNIIQSDRHFRKTYKVVEPQERIKKYTLTKNYGRNTENENKLYV